MCRDDCSRARSCPARVILQSLCSSLSSLRARSQSMKCRHISSVIEGISLFQSTELLMQQVGVSLCSLQMRNIALSLWSRLDVNTNE